MIDIRPSARYKRTLARIVLFNLRRNFRHWTEPPSDNPTDLAIANGEFACSHRRTTTSQTDCKSYDRLADEYLRQISNELTHKPLEGSGVAGSPAYDAYPYRAPCNFLVRPFFNEARVAATWKFGRQAAKCY